MNNMSNKTHFLDYDSKLSLLRKPKQVPGQKVVLIKEHSRGEHMVPIPKRSIGKVGYSRPFGPNHSIVFFEGFGYYHIHLDQLRMWKKPKGEKK
jgi:hypothetical protein